MYSRQCKLQLEDQETYRVTWIEEKYAKIGKRITLKDSENPDQIWVVSEVWSRMPTEEVKENERNYMKQREFSDV